MPKYLVSCEKQGYGDCFTRGSKESAKETFREVYYFNKPMDITVKEVFEYGDEILIEGG